MILVADSGSSKTDWILSIDGKNTIEFGTKGINPYFNSDKEISRLIANESVVKKYADQITEVYFFGEGCSNPDKREMVSNGLSTVFKNAFINVENDAIGSAYATCGNSKGFTCVLGSGSNIAFFDGESVHYGVHSLGFVLGNEGSGAYFGKELITSFLYETMPRGLRKAFKEQYQVDKEVVIKNVYQRPLPNIYLSSFTPFMDKYRSDEFVEDLLLKGLEKFVITHIVPYPDYRKYPCHFVGSIAWHFRDVLEVVCKKHHVQMGKILERPIGELLKYIQAESVKA
ncbi:MAG: N-acetylglucosamine kinase [Arcticibacter sp.]